MGSTIQRKRDREARQLGAPTDTHFCLSSFPLRAGSRQVTAGLHFWQTRGSSSLTKPCTTPPWLSAAVIKPRQPEPTNKKLTRYRSTAANFHEVVLKGRHCADSSGRGEGLLLGWGKTPAFGLITESPHSADGFGKLSVHEWSYCYSANEEKQPPCPVWYSNHKIQMRFSILSINSHPLQCLHVSSLPNQHFHS